MKKVVLYISLVILATVFVSCNKEGNDEKYQETKNAFLFNNSYFNTLQDAIKAAVALDDDDSVVEHQIRLVANTSGPGAVVSEDFFEYISLDLGRFDYTLTGGGTIEINNAQLTLTGEGGSIESLDKEKPLLQAVDGEIIIEKDVTLIARGEVIRTNSNVYVDESFRGEIEGDISLIVDSNEEQENYYNFDYYSNIGSMDIGTLTLTGNKATFDVWKKLRRAGAISIEHLKADNPNALRAIDASSIKLGKGGAIHVHNWTAVEHHGKTCVSNEFTIWHCASCDSYYREEKEDPTEGKCPAESLIHHKAVEPTAFEEGNIEYWECPLCGSLYADANALKPLEVSPRIEPLFENDDEDWLIDFEQFFGEEETRTKSTIPAKGIGTWEAIKEIHTFIGIINDGKGFAKHFLDPESPDQALYKNLKKDLDNLQKLMNDIKGDLGNKLNEMDAKNVLRTREENMSKLYKTTSICWETISNILINEKLSQAEKTEKIVNELKKWHPQDFYTNLTAYMESYCGTSFNSIPKEAEIFQNNKQLWEHQGYGWRSNYTAVDLIRTVICCQMELMYQELVASKESESAAIAIKNIHEDLDKYYKEYTRDRDRMKDRYAKYRVYVSGTHNDPYEIEAKNVDVKKWLTGNSWNKVIDCDYCRGKMKYGSKNIDQMLKELGMENALDQKTILDTRQSGTLNEPNVYKLLISLGFKNLDESTQKNLLVAYKSNGYWTDNWKSANVLVKNSYKIINWDIKTGSHSKKSQLYINSAIKTDGNYQDVMMMKNCKVRLKEWSKTDPTKMFGYIEDYGTYPQHAQLKYIKRAGDDAKAVKK